jgi:patatin-related protein
MFSTGVRLRTRLPLPLKMASETLPVSAEDPRAAVPVSDLLGAHRKTSVCEMIEPSEQHDVTDHVVLTPEKREAKLEALRAIHAKHIPAGSSQAANNQLQDNQIEREIRFAVVIYGGVSLTIYINGIVQEMLHLVRSTADDASKLSPVELVYRELATMVGEPAHPLRQPGSPKPLGDRPGKAGLVAAHKDSSAIRSRFIVDILCGTSAGGINAIYLAKALANNLSIDSLAKLWITQADLRLLLNDKKVAPHYLLQDPPPSLLNAPWMYLQLLTALNKMNLPDNAAVPQPLVQDLDLFCTTTDLRGLPVGIALTDESVEEQRYRNFYHFKRRTADPTHPDHDFTREMDPFLAFAARCTSSFPVAFEPMQLGDIPSVINRSNFSEYLSPLPPDQETVALFGSEVARLKGAGRFRKICQIYETGEDAGINFWERPFGDGGYLDNKPFTYAIETMKTRHADLPVDRKLIYIEPSPEDLTADQKQRKGSISRPNVVENSLDALVVLPRYETIRQDIESVIQWNADISRLHRVLDHINRTITNRSDLTLESLESSLGYATYQRLRLSGTSDQLGSRLAATVNVAPTSAQGQALRSIAGIWREFAFQGPANEQEFLDLFDFDYCERAIRFLRLQLQQLSDRRLKRQSLDELAKISALFMALTDTPLDLDVNASTRSPVAFDCWSQYLNFIVDPQAAARAMGVPFPYPDGFAAKPPDTVASYPPTDSPAFFSATDAGRDARVRWLFNNRTFTAILDLPPDSKGHLPTPVTFGAIVETISHSILNLYRQKLTPAEARQPQVIQEAGEYAIRYFFRAMNKLFEALKYLDSPISKGIERFRIQDVQIYSVIFGTTLGEFETVDIFRISPKETRPIDGTAPPGTTGSPTLRGQSLDAFGAFLDQDWRLSDMLRGRLDGAERLITAILPDSDADSMRVREQFIQKAQEAITREWQSFEEGLNLRTSPEKKRIIRSLLDKLLPPRETGMQGGN